MHVSASVTCQAGHQEKCQLAPHGCALKGLLQDGFYKAIILSVQCSYHSFMYFCVKLIATPGQAIYINKCKLWSALAFDGLNLYIIDGVMCVCPLQNSENRPKRPLWGP